MRQDNFVTQAVGEATAIGLSTSRQVPQNAGATEPDVSRSDCGQKFQLCITISPLRSQGGSVPVERLTRKAERAKRRSSGESAAKPAIHPAITGLPVRAPRALPEETDGAWQWREGRPGKHAPEIVADLRDGLCEYCTAHLTPTDLKACYRECADCRSRFPRE